MVLLQEAGGIPKYDFGGMECRHDRPTRRFGALQDFRTAILVRRTIEVELACSAAWATDELRRLRGNLVAIRADVAGFGPVHLASVYSPPWPIDRARLAGIDVGGIRLERNADVWMSDLVHDALRARDPTQGSSDGSFARERWIIGGDFNSSPTLDDGPMGDRGNREWLDRMRRLGLSECLAESQGHLVPTFRHSRGLVRHQLDHLFATPAMRSLLRDCHARPAEEIWGSDVRLSDHLPVVGEFGRAQATR